MKKTMLLSAIVYATLVVGIALPADDMATAPDEPKVECVAPYESKTHLSVSSPDKNLGEAEVKPGRTTNLKH